MPFIPRLIVEFWLHAARADESRFASHAEKANVALIALDKGVKSNGQISAVLSCFGQVFPCEAEFTWQAFIEEVS